MAKSLTPNLTDKIWRLNNFYKIRSKDKGIIPFRMNTHQKHICEDVINMSPIRHFTLKSRQVGLSTFWLLWHLDSTMFYPGIVTGVLAHKHESIQHLVSIVKIAIDQFPGKRIQLSEDNKTRISFGDCNSTIIFSLEIRSSPLHNLHLSEWCFCDNQRVWATVAATSKWTNITGESTGNGIGNDGYLTYMDGKEGKNGYKTIFIPWFEHEEYRLPATENILIRPEKRERDFNLDQEQIHFRRQMMARLKQAFFIEYPETEEDAFAQAGTNFFHNKKVATLVREIRQMEPPIEETDDYIVWEKPRRDHVYAAGLDTATGDGSDWSVLKIRCLTCRCEAATYRAKIRNDVFYRIVDEWGRKYNNMLIGVERNFPGNEILLGLKEICKYPNLYKEEEQTRIITDLSKMPKEPKFGWHTTPQTKPMMLEHLKYAIEGDPAEDENSFQPDFTVRDLTFLSEALTFRRNGIKLEATTGKNDDAVIAGAICNEMCLHLRKKMVRGRQAEVSISGKRETII